MDEVTRHENSPVPVPLPEAMLGRPAAWGQPPTAPTASGTEGAAVAALVFGIVPMLAGLLGIGLGVLGLRRIRRTGRRGRGFAIAGIVLGTAWLLFTAVGVALLIAEPTSDAAAPAGAGDGSLFADTGDVYLGDLKPGDCTRALPMSETSTLSVVPCASPHLAEVFALFALPDAPGSTFPGEERIDRLAAGGCERRANEQKLDPRGTELVWYTPNAETWPDGDRQVLCLAESASDRRKPLPRGIDQPAGNAEDDGVTALPSNLE